MCLILFAYRYHPRYQLVVAANRDEFFSRATAPMGFWQDNQDLLAGRDLEAGGTWLGVARKGRFAAITNFRDPAAVKADAPSRGGLVSGFLQSNQSSWDYLEKLALSADAYNGFNLLVWDNQNLCYYSNENSLPRTLAPGIYGLSNHLLNTPWPKVNRGCSGLTELVSRSDDLSVDGLLRLLEDRTRPRDAELPRTGVSLEWERALSPIFIATPTYGTRSSTVALFEQGAKALVAEKSWHDEMVRQFRMNWPDL